MALLCTDVLPPPTPSAATPRMVLHENDEARAHQSGMRGGFNGGSACFQNPCNHPGTNFLETARPVPLRRTVFVSASPISFGSSASSEFQHSAERWKHNCFLVAIFYFTPTVCYSYFLNIAYFLKIIALVLFSCHPPIDHLLS